MTPPQVGGDGHADVAQLPQATPSGIVSPDQFPPWPGPLGVNAGVFRESVPWTAPLANSAILVTDQVSLFAFGLVAGDRVSNIRFCSATTAANGPTHQTFGFYDTVGNRLCSTSDAGAAAWAANTMKSLPVVQVNVTPGSSTVTGATSWIVPYSGVFLVAITVTATVAVPTMFGVARAAGVFAATAFSFDSYIAGAALAGVLPNTVTLGTPGSAASSTAYAAVS